MTRNLLLVNKLGLDLPTVNSIIECPTFYEIDVNKITLVNCQNLWAWSQILANDNNQLIDNFASKKEEDKAAALTDIAQQLCCSAQAKSIDCENITWSQFLRFETTNRLLEKLGCTYDYIAKLEELSELAVLEEGYGLH